jgi:alkylation response protein AidB-like acyl-CoA dehydrogenase
MTGEAEFNEVFLDEVLVPDSMRLGAVGGGWTVTITTLMTERVMASGSVGPRSSGPIANAIEHWESQGRPVAKQDELVSLWVAAESLRLTQLRANESASRGTPGPEGSVAKLLWAELNKQITSFALNLLGPEGMLYPNGYEFIRPDLSQVRTDDFHKSFLRTRANSIEGGTSEVMRNILAERVLGLPGELRNDNKIPWRDIARNGAAVAVNR